jgi:protocatechuate 3,4-dioxygenase beta subunit
LRSFISPEVEVAAAPGSLTTQIDFEGDPYVDTDVVGAVKDSLVVGLVRTGEAAARCSYDFVLVPRSDAE